MADNTRTIRFKFDGTITFDKDMPNFPHAGSLIEAIAQAISAHAKTDGYLHPGGKIAITRASSKRVKRGSNG